LIDAAQFPTVVSYFVTLLTVVIITNSLNLIDGIDGLAAVFSFIAVLFFGTWFFFVSNYQYAIICLALCGAIFAFLFQNWEPSKIFMGDTGSLVIGTLLSIIGIQFINQNFDLTIDNPVRFNSSIGTAICVVILPLVDTTRIILIRLHKKISPFQPDKRHIHHALVRLNLSHKQAVYILTFIHVAVIGLAIIMRRMEQWQLIAVVVVVVTTLCIILDKLIIRAVQKENPLQQK
jgi:UDP-N-acetylmuramyl pentapeptide phosphotransferase/UDP-N-acetylglucosamine-1-phosphate transferase